MHAYITPTHKHTHTHIHTHTHTHTLTTHQLLDIVLNRHGRDIFTASTDDKLLS
jgi:hypothetical protein